jgi:exopolysaccharide biosynthesis protein
MNCQAEAEIHPCVDYSTPSTGIYVVKVRLSCDEVKILGTPEGQKGMTTSAFAAASKAIVAINGSFFRQNMFPVGLVITDGKQWDQSMDTADRSYLACDNVRHCSIDPDGHIGSAPFGTIVAVSGWQVFSNQEFRCIKQPNGVCSGPNVTMQHPRTGVGLNYDSSVLFLVVAEGRQHDFPGLTLSEFGKIFKELGIKTGLNLDGGGSTTLVVNGKRVNRLPVGQINERSVSNHLAISIRSKRME